jgi:hypothetical protein
MTMQARIAAMKEQNWLKPPAAIALHCLKSLHHCGSRTC